MSVFSTERFVAASGEGGDWREATRQVLAGFESAKAVTDGMNTGFLYLTDSLANDAKNILGLLRSVTGIQTWVGGVGLGICSCGQEYIDRPAMVAMAGKFAANDVRVIPPVDLNLAGAREKLEDWLSAAAPMLGLVHGDPMMETDPGQVLAELARFTGAFLAGGLCSSRVGHLQIANDVAEGGVSGLLFSQNVAVSTALSQGCVPLGPVHTVTRCDGHMLMELDGQRAFDVFAADLKLLAESKQQAGAKMAVSESLMREVSDRLETGGDVQQLFQGEVHVAFPVAGSDQNDYLVRNAIGVDPDNGWIAVAHDVTQGERMMFVHRDDASMRADLSRTLVGLRRRVIRERGSFAPKGAIYISCLARAMSDFGDAPDGNTGGEMRLVREILGDIPLAGFYANGEISNHRLYGYTAVIILFL